MKQGEAIGEEGWRRIMKELLKRANALQEAYKQMNESEDSGEPNELAKATKRI